MLPELNISSSYQILPSTFNMSPVIQPSSNSRQRFNEDSFNHVNQSIDSMHLNKQLRMKHGMNEKDPKKTTPN